jgi:hypothetical protein
MRSDSTKMMKKLVIYFGLLALGATALVNTASAQPFTYANNDLLLGFRKPGSGVGTFEVVVNIGKATNYVQAAGGASFAVPNFSLSQLTPPPAPGSFANLNSLNWSIFGFSKTNLTQVLPGYVNNVLWLTVPRTSPGVQSPVPYRLSFTSQGAVGTQIGSVGGGGVYLSSQTASNQYNTPKFIREPATDPASLGAYIQAVGDNTGSTFQGYWYQNVEISTPASFANCLISDLYEVWPTADALGHPVTDPHTGQTSGSAYYVGYFQFCPDGTMTFVRASASTTPPPPQLTVTRTGTTNLISFSSANGATYTLYYTNSAGLTQPTITWPSLPTTIIGDGSVKTFTNSAGDAPRYYRVGAQ